MGVRQKGQMWWCVLGLLMTVAFVVWVSGPAQAQQQEITGKDGTDGARAGGGIYHGEQRR